MKIALVYGGQPRFTYDFLDLMSRLKGFDSAHLYMVLWKSNWAISNEQAIERIRRVLKPNFSIGKIKVIDTPQVEYPDNVGHLSKASPQNTLWWYDRGFFQTIGTSLAFDLIQDDYDLVIKFRGDGSVDREVDLKKYDFEKTPILLPNNGKCGFADFKVNDQFAIGTQEMMKFYCSLGKEYKNLVPQSDPRWNESDDVRGATCSWGVEHLIGYRYKKNNIPLYDGDFGVCLNTYGRSKFTDKHYHHNIAKDPTEL
jgi:hypothetical protein